jgi:hypothetical protein
MTAVMPRGALPPLSRPPQTPEGRPVQLVEARSPWVQLLRQRLHDIPPDPPVPPPPPPEGEPDVREPPEPGTQVPVKDPPKVPPLAA